MSPGGISTTGGRCRTRRRLLLAAAAVAVPLTLVTAREGAAQTPGLPVLQGAFTTPGIAVAANYGNGDRFSTIAVAGSWTPSSNKYQLSGGVGMVSPEGDGDAATGGGVRAAMPIRTRWTGPDASLGAALFAGLGGAWRSGGGELRVPVGASAAYRRRLGATRALALYAAPYFQWSRHTGDAAGGAEGAAEPADPGDIRDSNLIRAAVGVDALLTSRLALSLGYDFGASAEGAEPGPTGGILGAGVSWRF